MQKPIANILIVSAGNITLGGLIAQQLKNQLPEAEVVTYHDNPPKDDYSHDGVELLMSKLVGHKIDAAVVANLPEVGVEPFQVLESYCLRFITKPELWSVPLNYHINSSVRERFCNLGASPHNTLHISSLVTPKEIAEEMAQRLRKAGL